MVCAFQNWTSIDYELCIMQLNIQSKEKTKNTITFETAIIDLKQRLMLENKYKIFRDLL